MMSRIRILLALFLAVTVPAQAAMALGAFQGSAMLGVALLLAAGPEGVVRAEAHGDRDAHAVRSHHGEAALVEPAHGDRTPAQNAASDHESPPPAHAQGCGLCIACYAAAAPPAERLGAPLVETGALPPLPPASRAFREFFPDGPRRPPRSIRA